MENAVTRIAETIHHVAMREDVELSELVNEGIFFVPELAFAYAVGKKIMEDRERVFSGAPVKWRREIDLGNGGPTDLVFQYKDGKRIAFEFKISGKPSAYLGDIRKLSNLPAENTARIFCALVVAFEKDRREDLRIQAVQRFQDEQIHPLLDPFPFFSTKQRRYQSPIACVVGIWSVGDIPKLKKHSSIT